MADYSSQEPEIEILSSSVEKDEDAQMKESPKSGGAELSGDSDEWKQKHDEIKEQLVWMAADFDNYKKRVLKEKDEFLKFSQAGILKELLVVVDNLERALCLQLGEGETGVAVFIKQGVELTFRQFQALLEKHGVRKLKTVGEKFDPRFHEVMFQEETDKFPDETVMEELQSGYLLHERVLRPALVKVAKNHKPVDG